MELLSGCYDVTEIKNERLVERSGMMLMSNVMKIHQLIYVSY